MEELDKDRLYMEEALQEARAAKEADEVPVGCVVVYEDQIIGRGRNSVESGQSALNHAELFALKEAAKSLGHWRLHGTTLYVTLEPCMMCLGAILHSRVDRVVFGAYDKKRGFCGSVEDFTKDSCLNHSVQVTGGVLEEECVALMQEFFQEKRERNRLRKTMEKEDKT